MMKQNFPTYANQQKMNYNKEYSVCRALPLAVPWFKVLPKKRIFFIISFNLKEFRTYKTAKDYISQNRDSKMH